ncbi:phospholipid phosphatase 4-like [Lepeophtheirus salmonis]|uniref:phospholipid phosphatase 4-like n=1 Tax=Lepeophtheirus salmonis TaxID=72036 RepID=UPI003AF4020C
MNAEMKTNIPRFNLLRELIIRACLTALFHYTDYLDPFRRIILINEAKELYGFPNLKATLQVLGVYYFKKDVKDLIIAVLTFTLIIPVTGLIVNVISYNYASNLSVGRPRPDFISRCWPLGDIPWSEFDDVRENQELSCTGDSELVAEGRKSFLVAIPVCHLLFSHSRSSMLLEN